jgi:hypothetical protein
MLELTVVVDLGCIFIGHGLSKDFRTISMFASVLFYRLPNGCPATYNLCLAESAQIFMSHPIKYPTRSTSTLILHLNVNSLYASCRIIC